MRIVVCSRQGLRHTASRTFAKLLKLDKLAEDSGQNQITLTVDDTFKELKYRYRSGKPLRLNYYASNYIPENLPPRELPGIRFEEPKSAPWRRFRTIVLPDGLSVGVCLP